MFRVEYCSVSSACIGPAHRCPRGKRIGGFGLCIRGLRCRCRGLRQAIVRSRQEEGKKQGNAKSEGLKRGTLRQNRDQTFPEGGQKHRRSHPFLLMRSQR